MLYLYKKNIVSFLNFKLPPVFTKIFDRLSFQNILKNVYFEKIYILCPSWNVATRVEATLLKNSLTRLLLSVSK